MFFNGRIFESHPLTILTAPPSVSCISSTGGALTLAARVQGDWTRALNEYATEEQARLGGPCHEDGGEKSDEKKEKEGKAPLVQVMVDGAYGGCSVDIGEYETVLLVAGGSGATFTIGLLDDIVGRCVKLGRSKGERTRRIEFVWCIRSFGTSLKLMFPRRRHQLTNMTSPPLARLY